MAYQGYNSCDDGDSYDTGTGNDWNNEDNIENASQATYATSAVNANPVEPTEYLVGRDYDFSLPPGATIDGVEVKVSHWTASRYVRDKLVKLWYGAVSADNSIGNDKSTGTDWAMSSDEVFTYGGSADTWGYALTKTIVESNTFGACMVAERHDGALGDKGVRCHYILIKVWYTGEFPPGKFFVYILAMLAGLLVVPQLAPLAVMLAWLIARNQSKGYVESYRYL